MNHGCDQGPPDGHDPGRGLDDLRIDIAKLFGFVVAASALVMVAMGVVMIYLVGFQSAGTYDRVVSLRVFQIAFGNFFGGVCVYLGVLLSWFGIKEALRLSGRTTANWRLALNTASPGVVLMLGGMALVAASMFCKVEISEPADDPGPAAMGAEEIWFGGEAPDPSAPEEPEVAGG